MKNEQKNCITMQVTIRRSHIDGTSSGKQREREDSNKWKHRVCWLKFNDKLVCIFSSSSIHWQFTKCIRKYKNSHSHSESGRWNAILFSALPIVYRNANNKYINKRVDKIIIITFIIVANRSCVVLLCWTVPYRFVWCPCAVNRDTWYKYYTHICISIISMWLCDATQ